jgi:NAD-dependent DNA ligase
MLSLENSYNAKDLEERDQRINKILEKIGKPYELMYYVEPKFD